MVITRDIGIRCHIGIRAVNNLIHCINWATIHNITVSFVIIFNCDVEYCREIKFWVWRFQFPATNIFVFEIESRCLGVKHRAAGVDHRLWDTFICVKGACSILDSFSYEPWATKVVLILIHILAISLWSLTSPEGSVLCAASSILTAPVINAEIIILEVTIQTFIATYFLAHAEWIEILG